MRLAQCLILAIIFIRLIKGIMDSVEYEDEKTSDFSITFEVVWTCISLFVVYKAGLFSEII